MNFKIRLPAQLLAFYLTIFSYSFLPASGVSTAFAKRNDRTVPPPGAVIVRGNNTQVGEFSSVQAAVNSLDDNSQATIFVFPGKYYSMA